VIFVTVGTNHARFDRLLAPFVDWDGHEDLVVQHGPSALRPAVATCRDFLPFDESVATIASARMVVTHAGVGSVLLALAHSKRPVVVARLHRFGEAVDDHQQAFAARLARAGLVTLVDLEHDGEGALLAALEAAPPLGNSLQAAPDLAMDLHRYVESVIAH
jgi:UDP-N-acetylglucosamine transferase subunit ALG13